MLNKLDQNTIKALIREAIRTGKPKKKSDGGGMSLHVKPKGNQWSASWLYDFRIAGKPDTTSLGQYPEVPLKEARERLVDARRLVFEKRINPADQRRADRRAAIDAANAKSLADANTFKFVAEEWLGRQKGEEKTKQARNSRVAKLYPEIGHRPISEIGSSELLRAIRKIEAEGKLHTVKRIRNLCNSIWDYAILEGKATFNIAGPLQRAFNTKSTEHLAALTDPKAVGKLMLAIDGYSSPLTKAGLKLLAPTFARPGEVRKMTWSQIDFDKAIWTVPIGNIQSNTHGNGNTGMGASALALTTGSYNTAVGYNALNFNSTASNNSAFGNGALQYNVTGSGNIASGAFLLFSNTSGNYNSAYGVQALYLSTASNNAATGYRALYRSTTGTDNTATGFAALLNNTTGNGNTGVGYNALNVNTTGMNNIAIGTNAGYSVTGSNNIDIGSVGAAGESGVIRLGSSSQSAIYVAGITTTHLTGAPVYVDSKGQLGVLASSERYKTEIEPMGGVTNKLDELRPVSFHLRNDPQGPVQYGLIAEEVNKLYPELVIRDEAGKIQGVRYDELAPMLLNELQQARRKMAAQDQKIRDMEQQVAELNDLKQEMRAALVKLQEKSPLSAQR